jgi:hydrogenase nickel incorporation protein HypB
MPKEIIEVNQDIYEDTSILAREINKKLTEKKIYTVNILGGAGAGKTSVLIQIANRLGSIDKFVIEGDLESDIDTKKLQALGFKSYQINTHGTCHLNAPMIQAIIGKIELGNGGMLFIENIGNLVCPAEFEIGEHLKVLICSVPEGSDKPYKYPIAFQKAGAVILNKKDLMPYIDFDRDYFLSGVRAVNPVIPVFEVSCKTGEGFDAVVGWLLKSSSFLR